MGTVGKENREREINMDYKTRKDQVDGFIRKANLPLTTKAEMARFRQAMRDACMAGACEERGRICEIIRKRIPIVKDRIALIDEIINTPVLEVLGFEKGE